MIEPWKLIRKENEFRNQYVNIDKFVYQMPDGSQADYFIRDGGKDVASILAITEDGKFVIAKEFRPGPQRIMFELPGGIIDEGENPLEAAKRELLEESGYAGELKLLGSTYLSAYSSHKKYCFLALDCKKVAEQKLGLNEFIEIELLDTEQFLKLIESGEMTDLETALWGWHYLQKHD